LKRVRSRLDAEGFKELDLRFTQTRMTAIWFELMMTFPLVFVIALPLVSVLYFLEFRWRRADGMNVLWTLRKGSSREESTGREGRAARRAPRVDVLDGPHRVT
jgi:hypothetical protein